MIRPAEIEDLERIADLYRRVMELRTPEDALVEWFRRMVFEQPWAREEVPALVSEESGRLTGFLASHPRPLRIDGEPGVLACSGQLVVEPEARRRAAGAMLLRTYLKGPQDLTITDGATLTVRAIWTRLGGRIAYPQSIEWYKPLRAGSLAGWMLSRGRRGTRASGGGPSGLARGVDRLLERLPAPRPLQREPAPTETEVSELEAAGLVELAAGALAKAELRVDYGEPEPARWLLDRLAAVTARGELRARVLRDSQGEAVGGFVYYLRAGGLSPVVAILAADGERAGPVLDALFADAAEGGAAAVYGRLEPILGPELAARSCPMRYVGHALVHSSRPEVLAMLGSEQAQLTRLDGEWWMGPHLDVSAGAGSIG